MWKDKLHSYSKSLIFPLMRTGKLYESKGEVNKHKSYKGHYLHTLSSLEYKFKVSVNMVQWRIKVHLVNSYLAAANHLTSFSMIFFLVTRICALSRLPCLTSMPASCRYMALHRSMALAYSTEKQPSNILMTFDSPFWLKCIFSHTNAPISFPNIRVMGCGPVMIKLALLNRKLWSRCN